LRRLPAVVATTIAILLALADPAAACGGLVAPNGAVELQRTTTLAAYHDGVEHYVTSFAFAGTPTDFGSIIPLPGVPTDVRRAGSWTLQRLERETHPVVLEAGDFGGRAASAAGGAGAQVLLQTKVDALDITVLSGGGPAVLDWIRQHGYAVSPDAPAMLDFYAHRSPVFLAARFDAAAAVARGQRAGDGTPVQITIPTPHPWVPLHILSLAKGATANVQADVYLLNDRAPTLLEADPAVSVRVSEPATSQLLGDLRSDKDSSWVPDRAWLTEVDINGPAGQLTHDLAIDDSGAGRPSAVQAGYDPLGAVPDAVPVAFRPVPPAPAAGGHEIGGPLIVAAVLAGLLVIALAAYTTGRRRPLMP
jgi:hypothetical protein